MTPQMIEALLRDPEFRMKFLELLDRDPAFREEVRRKLLIGRAPRPPGARGAPGDPIRSSAAFGGNSRE
jgi:hypothetical protein